ncbi:hypothetical protein Desdi_0227 [Desulfitobacterium dichloroeliminans LMG P-21439]|uniref:HTH merR-type domain-containing protein n=1 Tax=Desulfitobacterium dichloroeliminans (strain LMG P-21439 / DCA1) TaxID=871963 RepID=L0F3L8_DESDL|nr:MerR family transcriptional regulator [Desulfitobacterium dichloroeliminans]AGA67777.1 hypothetical protein Desdi_0227 [Desulfitobacterium dichloroeliminans LMG P-21439]
MIDEEKGLYTIGTVAELIAEHPETLRVWERNELIRPNREGYQRKYSNNDLIRLKFIKYLMHDKGLNIAGVKHLTSMYSCWYKRNCKGGALKNSSVGVNETKPCWKAEGTFCLVASDKSELCNSCEMLKGCTGCTGCNK